MNIQLDLHLSIHNCMPIIHNNYPDIVPDLVPSLSRAVALDSDR
jgi:hypothetical protein